MFGPPSLGNEKRVAESGKAPQQDSNKRAKLEGGYEQCLGYAVKAKRT